MPRPKPSATANGAESIPETLETLRVPIDTLHEYPQNPRRGDPATIAESLKANGQYRPIVVRQATREVLAGNHTLRAARQLGWQHIAATFVDVDDTQAARIVLVDNRTNDLAAYDDEALADLIQSLPALDGTGYDTSDLDSLLRQLDIGDPGRDTEPSELPEKPRTGHGELILLGEHRLLCGDATDRDAYKRLMGDERAELLWTDPPYGVDYVGKTKRGLTIASDTREDLSLLLIKAWEAATGALSGGAPFYVMGPQGPGLGTTLECLRRAGWHLHQGLVWVKDAFVLGHSDYHYRHEPILYGWIPGAGRSGRGAHDGSKWYGDNAQTSVFEVARPRASESHPTMKPVELIERCLGNSSQRTKVVLDPFAGSGSTLIACENLGRRCYALEIDPAYCDVIIDRWQRHTGSHAKRT